MKQRNVTSTTGENCHIYAFAPSMTEENLPYRDVNGIDMHPTRTYHPCIIKKYVNMRRASFAGGPYTTT